MDIEPINIVIRPNKIWEAPIEIPTHIEKSKNPKFIGSLTAVLNLTTDKAPTKPKERASEDFTTAINAATLMVTIKMVFP